MLPWQRVIRRQCRRYSNHGFRVDLPINAGPKENGAPVTARPRVTVLPDRARFLC